MPNFEEKDCESGYELNNNLRTDVAEPQQKHPFACISTIPSRIESSILREVNMALLLNIQAGILDTPTCAFIPKLATFAEFSSTQLVIANYENQAKENIIKRRRERL